MNRDRTFRTSAAIVLIVATTASSALAGGSQPYLPRIGPPPLRFRAPVTTPPPVFPLLAPETPAVSLRPPISEEPQIEPRTDLSTPDLSSEPVTSLLPQPAPPDSPGPAPQSAANDLLIISPQMLIDYLKPGLGATNGAVSAVVPVTFTPATPAAPPSSRAIYKSE